MRSGSGIRNLFDPGSGMEKFGSGIRDKKHPGSATQDLILDKENKNPVYLSVYPSFAKHGHSGWTAFLMVSTTP